MSSIKPYQDSETRRQYRNLTSTQRKNVSEMKEGVVVNTLIKESNLTNMYDSLIIPDRVDYRNYVVKEEPKKSKSLKSLLLTTLGIFGLLAGATAAVSQAAKHRTQLPVWKTLPEVPKNIAINNEPHFVTYLMIQDPNTKTVLGALGVFLLSAIGLVGKNFVDGAKDIWVSVARDARTHSESLTNALIKGVTSTGACVLNIGMVPTPLGYFSEFAQIPDTVHQVEDIEIPWQSCAKHTFPPDLRQFFRLPCGLFPFRPARNRLPNDQAPGESLLPP